MKNIDEARKAASEAAKWDLQGLYTDPTQELLDSTYRETADCWLFFQHVGISIPPERSLSHGAYAISKHSMEERFVPDLRGDELRLVAYMQLLSSYFAKAAQTGELPVKNAGV